MKIIEEPGGMYSETYYGLTEREYNVIQPLIDRALRHAEKMVEHYTNLTCDGYGTERQATSLMKWEDKVEMLSKLCRKNN